MRFTVYHGSPSEPFRVFDPSKCGKESKYEHAKKGFFFTSKHEVARGFAGDRGFIGVFVLTLENPLIVEDQYKDRGYSQLLSLAEMEGHDALILRNANENISPGEVSDIYAVFDPDKIKYEREYVHQG